MRQNKFIATKDHVILIAASNEVGDELWAGHDGYNQQSLGEYTSNAIGFIASGSANSFINNSDADESWDHYGSAKSPLMLVRKNFSDLGLVSTSEKTIFGSVLSRDRVFSIRGPSEILIQNLNDTESHTVSSSTDTVNVERKCKVYQKRDPHTFDSIYGQDLDINVISDSEIEIEGV